MKIKNAFEDVVIECVEDIEEDLRQLGINIENQVQPNFDINDVGMSSDNLTKSGIEIFFAKEEDLNLYKLLGKRQDGHTLYPWVFNLRIKYTLCEDK